MKQKFKGKFLTRAKVVNNILATFNRSIKKDRINWYNKANLFADYLSRKHRVELVKVCGIISALSPLKSWQQNKVIADLFLRNGKGMHTKVMLGKARDITASNGDITEICDILNGLKITSFFLNIFNPNVSETVTIDRHAIAVALGRNADNNEQRLTSNQYRFFQECYKIAGIKLNISPLQVQSTTWECWRREKRGNDIPLPF